MLRPGDRLAPTAGGERDWHALTLMHEEALWTTRRYLPEQPEKI